MVSAAQTRQEGGQKLRALEVPGCDGGIMAETTEDEAGTDERHQYNCSEAHRISSRPSHPTYTTAGRFPLLHRERRDEERTDHPTRRAPERQPSTQVSS